MTCRLLTVVSQPVRQDPGTPVSVSKRLFDGLEVEPGPALPGGVLLPSGGSSTLHPQLRLISSVLQVQTDGGVVL